MAARQSTVFGAGVSPDLRRAILELDRRLSELRSEVDSDIAKIKVGSADGEAATTDSLEGLEALLRALINTASVEDRAYADAADDVHSAEDRAYTDAEVDKVVDALFAHLFDTENAHEARAISYDPSFLNPISKAWFGAQPNVQRAISQLVAEVDGRIEAGDVNLILQALNNWEEGDVQLDNPDVFKADLIVTKALAARAVVASKIAANAITAANISADAIDGNHVRAGTQLTVGEGANRITITGTSQPQSTSIRSGGLDLGLTFNQGDSVSMAPVWGGPGDAYKFIVFGSPTAGFVKHPNGRPLLLRN